MHLKRNALQIITLMRIIAEKNYATVLKNACSKVYEE